MPAQKGGGSVGQSLRYVDPAAPEQSAAAGTDLLKQQGLIVRPSIGGGQTRKKKGGFFPSVMSGVVNAGMYLAPLTAIAGRRLFSQKQRRGGGKKGNVFRAQKEEAKAELDVIGKASAANVLAFVAAKRRGSEAAEEYLAQFRKKKQEKNEANTARRRAKEEAKAAKAAERAAKKASKKASKKAKKPASAASSASTVSTAASNNNNEKPVTKAQMMREAAENAARAKAEANAAKAAAKKPLKNSQVAWFSLVENAAKRLAGNGTPTRKNAMRYASLLKQGKNAEASAFLANFRARSRKSNKKPAPKAAESSAAAAKAPSAAAAAGNNSGATKKRKSPSAASKRYFEELKEARRLLGEVGHPTGPNMSKFASMRLKGENTSEFLRNFASRRPKSLATAKAGKKAKAAPAPAKALSAVAEKNENENEMQGYSENFEPEED